MLVLLGPVALALAGGHAVADYGLQSTYVAEYKVRVLRRRGPGDALVDSHNPDWFVTLAAHCLIHALVVLCIAFAALMGGRMLDGDTPRHATLIACGVATALGWLEFGIHFAIDDAKGRGRFSYRVDQGLHYLCKIAWLGVIGMAVA